ncbi:MULTISPECIES: helix-turn-helix domain-containing protein [Streptomyces]|uniref:XRE family transcriptional regulator n=2 Tax=Streptomyces TaxID=1883 RepID=A0A420V7U2_9ACTN|nr:MULTISPECIES: helix-turn-helix transcriptional regulator [Streptomyces]KNE82251.1 DNA-binding protein [Streptomyces fradiae]OFA56698.1 transcriptional regulator [Streptomyces fradiae]PQM22850.1 XRE family transcriptional regulator [Streptomyces xinghaiensis]RKM98020.1 XRE family transcriptional regulator [Streptomyces xinghaiensis]RNC73842.1 XRE family transcriptional regulator [Streptomyces xinghaiensis]
MPPANTPTLRQRRLGAELRKLRERAGLSSTAAAAVHGMNQARVSSIEAGRYAVSAERVRTLARNYTCGDERLVEALAGMTGGRTRGWWDEYRDILPSGLQDLAELEHHATALRVASVVHIPGLLQTHEHARAVFREVVPPLLPYEVEHRVSYRIKRQVALHGERPTSMTAILHEAALRMGFGGSATAKAQLQHLIDMSEQPNLTLAVVPFGKGAFPGSGQPIVYASGQLAQLDTVQLDTEHGVEFLDAEAQLAKYRSVLDRMEACALPPDESRELVHRIKQEA